MSEQLCGIKLYTKEDYFNEVAALADAADPGSRMALMTMNFDPTQPHVDQLVQSLGRAATRSNVMLLLDAYDFMFDRRDVLPIGPVMLYGDASRSRHPYHLEKLEALNTLQKAGGLYRIINYPERAFSNPYRGHSHVKGGVMNNRVLGGGGNMDFMQIDLMFALTHPELADWLYGTMQDIYKVGRVREALNDQDQRFEIDSKTTMFMDAGVPDQSIILDEDIPMIDEAQEWLLFTCQYYPQGVVADHLAAAHRRGARIMPFYNHPSKHTTLQRLLHTLGLTYERLHQPAELFTGELPKDHARLHAKVLATENGAIVGSHNCVEAGVKLGTAELALQRRTPAFALEVARFILKQLKPTDSVPAYAALQAITSLQ